MSEYRIYHNPSCSKSRKTLEILNEKGISPVIIDYKEVGLTEYQVDELLTKLNTTPSELIRNKEEDFISNPFDVNNREEVTKSLVQTPQLLQRPIVVKGNKAILCRPPENVLELI